jgi:signal peptidase I
MTVPEVASTVEGGADPGLDGGTSDARPRTRRSRRWLALGIGSAAPWVIALGATSIVVQTLLPTRMEGASGGLATGLARVTDEHPLALAVVLFLVFLEIASYWWRWAARLGSRATPARSATGGLPDDGRQGSRATSASLFRLAVKVAASLALALLVRETLVRTYRVVSPSMVPTLNVGDRLLVNRIAYGFRLPLGGGRLGARLPRRGDIIVFSDESAADGGAHGPKASVTPTGPVEPEAPVAPKVLVKRVIGLPGDFVAFRDGAAFVNGWGVPACDAGPFVTSVGPLTVRGRLAVEFLEERAYLTIRTPLDEASFPGYRVPPGQVFVLGDDRGMSSDSRAWNEGRGAGVPLARIEGRVSRRAIATLPEGGPDLMHLLPPLNLKVRQPYVDLRQTEERIAACLSRRPRSTRPPAAASAASSLAETEP